MDDSLKQKTLIALAAFNLTIIAYQILLNSNPFSWGRLAVGLVLSLAAGGIAFGIAHVLGNR